MDTSCFYPMKPFRILYTIYGILALILAGFELWLGASFASYLGSEFYLVGGLFAFLSLVIALFFLTSTRMRTLTITDKEIIDYWGIPHFFRFLLAGYRYNKSVIQLRDIANYQVDTFNSGLQRLFSHYDVLTASKFLKFFDARNKVITEINITGFAEGDIELLIQRLRARA